MDINTIIEKKRLKWPKGELTAEEIKYFIGKYTKNEIDDVQVAALMSYIYINGLSENEMFYFVKEIGTSGDILDLSGISQTIIDKHSIGVIGDKVTLILLPIISALGLPVASVSSKECGILGGTIDRLCAIPGFTPNISIDDFVNNISNIGISIVSENLNLAPIEEKFYKLRNKIACKDCIELMAISLMSLKMATGSNVIVFELGCGKCSYLKDKNAAKKLGRILVKLGKRLDKKVRICYYIC